MPIHDWTRVPAGLYHDFHQSWCIRLKDALNSGTLPKGLSALVEQRIGSFEADVLTVQRPTKPRTESGAGTQVLERPADQIARRNDRRAYARRANRIVVKHHLGRIVAVIEIVSPGNKDSQRAIREFVEKTGDYLHNGIHALVVDLFPPTPRDPHGLHPLIWAEFGDEDAYAFPSGKDRLVASYEAGIDQWAAYLEPRAVGEALSEIPLFVSRDYHIRVPLETTYMATWNASPEDMRVAVESGVLPEE